jgi:hypothetical protein
VLSKVLTWRTAAEYRWAMTVTELIKQAAAMIGTSEAAAPMAVGIIVGVLS